MKKTRLNWCVYVFSVDYNAVPTAAMQNIHIYLMV